MLYLHIPFAKQNAVIAIFIFLLHLGNERRNDFGNKKEIF